MTTRIFDDERSRSADDSAVPDRLADVGERELVVGGDRPIRFSAGHRLLHHDGKCSRPHGHNYEVTVRVAGDLGAEGWVVDKGAVTAVWNIKTNAAE